jgi:hypothetical protein
MRNAEAHVTLGVAAARAGDIDAAIAHGYDALNGTRKSVPTLRMVSGELGQVIADLAGEDDPRVRDYKAELRIASQRP